MHRLARLTLLMTTLAMASAPAAEPAADLAPFRIKDQHDRLLTDARFRGTPLLILWGDRAGAEVMNRWGPALADSLAAPIAGYRLRLLEVAHGKGAPFFVKGKIKGSFRSEGRGPVLMDWDGVFARTYAPEPDRCNAWLFDADGRLQATWSAALPDTVPPADLVLKARDLAH